MDSDVWGGLGGLFLLSNKSSSLWLSGWSEWLDEEVLVLLMDELNVDNLNVEDLDNKVKEGDNIDKIKEILSHINNEFNTDEIGISDKLSQIIKSLSKEY